MPVVACKGHMGTTIINKPPVVFKRNQYGLLEDKNIRMGFLLGDVVWTPGNWDAALKDISLLSDSIYFSRGNHDGSLKLFEKRFGKS